MLERERPGRRPRGDSELREDVLEVAGDGVLADHQLLGDVPVAPPARDQAQDLELAIAEPVRRAVAADRRSALRPGRGPAPRRAWRSRRGRRPAPARPCRGRPAPGRPARSARGRAPPRTGRRGPATGRPPARSGGSASAAAPAGELDGGPSPARRAPRAAPGGALAARSSQLLAAAPAPRRGRPRASMTSTQPGSRMAPAGRARAPRRVRARSRPRGCRGLALRDAQARQPRLGLAPGRARLAVRGLGAASAPREPVELALPVEGLAGGGAVLALGQRSAALRASTSASSQAPSSWMISARWTRQRPVKATRLGLLVAPPGQRRGPLPRPPHARRISAQARITPQ